ncbi:MAG: CpsB/CapC family capsule biosynthesis tyrosine phosphatase [Bacteroidota bacterium]|nr:CpsB/CapC family capsule biosynthesis tyrosine phosphatase [Bacteroidota bacterium]
MFNKRKNIPLYPGFSWLAQDIHSHILPGIDDGSPDVETSLQLLQSLSEAGIHQFICTPHIIGDMYRNTPESVNNALATLKNACLNSGVNVSINAAAEYMLDDYFMDLLRKKEPLLTLTKNYILTELSYAASPGNLEKISFELNTNNYQPLMAHPERYHYYHKNYDAYYRLKELGFLLQVNLLSITGYYGKNVAKAAKYILKNDLADFVGTDLHHFTHLQVLTDTDSIKLFEKYFGNKMYNEFT